MRLNYQQRRHYVGLLFVLPWIIGFIWFQLTPMFTSLYYSFTEFNMVADPIWVGLKNFTKIFIDDRNFDKSLLVTLKYTAMTIPMKIVFSLIIAIVLNQKMRFINIYRTVFYLPSIFGGSVAIAILWRFLFQFDGAINEFVKILGLQPQYWLGSSQTALFTISLISVWQFGSSMVIFLAALKQVPTDLYEAAAVEGAGKIRTFFSITLPFLTPMILFNTVMQTINALQEFTGAFVITNGGPVKSTLMYVMNLYQEAFLFNKMGYASALSWILFIVIVVITLVIFRSANLWVFYADGGDS